MRKFLIQKSEIYIENYEGQSTIFKDIKELLYYSGIDFTYTSLNQVSYEPERGIHTWFDGVNTTLMPLPDVRMDNVINMVSVLIERQADPYYGLAPEERKKVAYDLKMTALNILKYKLNNVNPFMSESVMYVNDEVNIQGVKVQVLDKSRDASLPTFIGTPMQGCWKSYDDSFVPFTNGEFIDKLCEDYFSMRSHNFTNHGILVAELADLFHNEEKTEQDINDFDITVGWSLLSVV
jgi:hypothetical protein